MNTKRIIFSIILLVAVSLLVTPLIKKTFMQKEISEGIIFQEGEYEIGKDFQEGEYDLKITGNLVIQGKSFHDGSRVNAMPLREGGIVLVEGDGKLHMEPAQFQKLNHMDGRLYSIDHSGYYHIGKQVTPGKYLLRYESETELEEIPFVQTIDSDSNVLETFYFEGKDQFIVELQEGTIIQIEKTLMNEVADLRIILEKE